MLALMYSMVCHNVARNKVPHVLGIAIHPVATKRVHETLPEKQVEEMTNISYRCMCVGTPTF